MPYQDDEAHSPHDDFIFHTISLPPACIYPCQHMPVLEASPAIEFASGRSDPLSPAFELLREASFALHLLPQN